MKIDKFIMILIAFTWLLSLVVSRTHKKFFRVQTRATEQSCKITLYDNDDNELTGGNQNDSMSVTIGCTQSTSNATFKYLTSDLESDIKKVKLTTGAAGCQCKLQARNSSNGRTVNITLNGSTTYSTTTLNKTYYVLMMVCEPYGSFKTTCDDENNRLYNQE